LKEISVIFDGQCDLCKNSITWVSKKLKISALDFHTADLSKFELTKEQCTQEVFVVYEDRTVSGADAVALLLKLRGNRATSILITALGPISRFVYRWIASNRKSAIVKIISRLLA
jgi:predicted DCC family thiol-disulfide oxidoreductase YuxK